MDEIRRSLGGSPALFFDYDGTLTPIVSHYGDAHLDDRTEEALSSIAGRFPVAIVSGRSASDVRDRVGIRDIIYAGSHGQEIEYPNGTRFEHPGSVEALGDLDHIEGDLAGSIVGLAGVTLERKPFAIAVHTRNAEQEADRNLAIAVVERLVGRTDALMLRKGKEVLEVRPSVDWDKGKAISLLVERLPAAHKPLFIGDDETDEDGFRAVGSLDGVGILVAEGSDAKTAARFQLRDPAAVVRFIEAF